MTNEKRSINKFLRPLKSNYWISASIILAILLSFSFFSNSCTGAVVSPETAGANVLQFALNQGADAELVSVVDTGSLYEITISISGEETAVYATYDGESLVPYIYPLKSEATTQPEETAIPTSSNPTSELYIWSYCPYGVTALTPFAEVAELLGGNFKVRRSRRIRSTTKQNPSLHPKIGKRQILGLY